MRYEGNAEVSGINRKIKALLEENRSLFEGKPIVFDGVVDEAAFLNSGIRTAFLLKEVNDRDRQEDWEDFLDNYVRKQAYTDKMYTTWPNVCLWMEALKEDNIFYRDCLNGNGSFDVDKLQQNLLDIAIVNIKKTAGGSASNHNELVQAADRYGFVVRRQMELIGPRLVICGGTFEYAKSIFGVEEQRVRMLPSGAEYFQEGETVYLQFVHPVWYTVSRKILFAYAKVTFAEVKNLLGMV